MNYGFEQYITKKNGFKITGYVLLIISMGFMVLSMMVKEPELPEPEAFYGFDDASYCYLDIVSISDWVYEYEDQLYYICEDIDDYLYVVQIDEDRRDLLTEQVRYWTESETMKPRKYRLYGTPRLLNDDEVEFLGDFMEYEDYDDVYSYFGENCFMENTLPDNETKLLLIGFSLLIGGVGLLSLVPAFFKDKRNNKKLNQLLEFASYQQVQSDFENTHILTEKDEIRLGRRYLYLKGGYQVLQYSDVLWVYPFSSSMNALAADTIYLYTGKDDKPFICKFTSFEGKQVCDYVISEIQKHHPQVLVGDSEENRILYESKKNIS